jgi:hypothetical protein
LNWSYSIGSPAVAILHARLSAPCCSRFNLAYRFLIEQRSSINSKYSDKYLEGLIVNIAA